MEDTAVLLKAMAFAAHKHRTQRRKGPDASPYINHLVDVANLLANVGEVADLSTLVAAILHDTIEDTETNAEELEQLFGPTVRRLVEEVTDNKALPKAERKRLQVEHAAHISDPAKLIKLADKTCNARDVMQNPPEAWSTERCREYLDWSERVVAGCRGLNARLEREFDGLVREGRASLDDGAP